MKGGTGMLQSIQYIGSGPPTYVYSQEASGTSSDFYHVFATETREYDSRKDHRERSERVFFKRVEKEVEEVEEFKVPDYSKTPTLLDIYQREYGKRESFLWKQK